MGYKAGTYVIDKTAVDQCAKAGISAHMHECYEITGMSELTGATLKKRWVSNMVTERSYEGVPFLRLLSDVVPVFREILPVALEHGDVAARGGFNPDGNSDIAAVQRNIVVANAAVMMSDSVSVQSYKLFDFFLRREREREREREHRHNGG